MKKKLFSALIVILIVFVWVCVAYSLTQRAVNGTICKAANLNQAFDLKWDHVRVINNSTQTRWVVCPVEAATDHYKDAFNNTTTGDELVAGVVQVMPWFGSGAAPGAGVTCIWRSLDHNGIVSETISMTDTAPATMMSTSLDASFAGTHSPVTFLKNWTITCSLAPQSGINEISVQMTKAK